MNLSFLNWGEKEIIESGDFLFSEAKKLWQFPSGFNLKYASSVDDDKEYLVKTWVGLFVVTNEEVRAIKAIFRDKLVRLIKVEHDNSKKRYGATKISVNLKKYSLLFC